MPAFAFSGLQIWELVTHLRALAISNSAAETKGDRQAGAAIFAANCSRCHAVAGKGQLTGPDLTGIGTWRTNVELREAVLDPDAEVPKAYWSVAAITSSGKTVRGVRLNEDSFSIQLRDDEGRLQSLLKRDVRNIELIRRSPMPSFRGKLSDGQVDDVIAWLVSVGRQQ